MDDALQIAAALPTLRLLTCGSVDDGKSTLIGRLLYEKKLIFDDQLSALDVIRRDSARPRDAIDFALLVDGLEAEREQGITIDVAYRYFATDSARSSSRTLPATSSTPATWRPAPPTPTSPSCSSTRERALLTQTHRHSIIASLLGVRHIVLAVNKIDLVGYDEKIFRDIVIAYRKFAETLGFRSLYADPTLGPLRRQRVVEERAHALVSGRASPRISRTDRGRGGPPRGAVPPAGAMGQPPASRFPRHRRHDRKRTDRDRRPDRRGRLGTADHCQERIVADTARGSAGAGDAVTLTLADELDIARGDVLAHPNGRPEVADQFAANVIWMSAEPMLPGRSYLMKIGTTTVPASVTDLKPGSTSTISTSSPPSGSTSTRSASAISRPPCRSPTTPTPRIARRARSS